jgi:hypothetical protein
MIKKLYGRIVDPTEREKKIGSIIAEAIVEASELGELGGYLNARRQ